MRGSLVAVVFAICSGCTAVLGLDPRERAIDDDASTNDASFDAIEDEGERLDSGVPMIDATTPDTSTSPDTAVKVDSSTPPPDTSTPPPDTSTPPPDTSTPPPDTGPETSGPCPIFGLTCAAGRQCIVSRSATTGAYSYACEVPPTTTGSNCALSGGVYKCPAGNACKERYPSGNICVPLCSSATMCAAPYDKCLAVTWTSGSPTNVCSTCDPVNDVGCSLVSATRCGVGSPTTVPTCRSYGDFGGRDPGQTCPSGDACRVGSVCVCGGLTGGGTPVFGIDACATTSGTCVELCRTNADCGTGKTCTSFSGTSYRGCL